MKHALLALAGLLALAAVVLTAVTVASIYLAIWHVSEQWSVTAFASGFLATLAGIGAGDALASAEEFE